MDAAQGEVWQWGALLVLIELWALVAALGALRAARTPQGAIAWVMGLLMMPFLGLPLYYLFGRDRFVGYATARRRGCDELHALGKQVHAYGLMFRSEFGDDAPALHAVEHLARLRFTHSNDVKLLIDGEATFGAIFGAIEAAEAYVLVQFFIIRDDGLGRELRRRLIERAQAGVRVYLLYDEVGSLGLPGSYLEPLREAGVEVIAFETNRGPTLRWQLNFRNHRKTVIVDGRVALIGGANVGDEYMGLDPDFSPWRDTHVELRGPAVQGAQLAFVEDWYWNTHEIPALRWEPEVPDGGRMNALVLPTGPADEVPACELFFIHAINTARERLWIATPYFVPSAEVLQALRLAALRGVQVRIVLPERPDHLLVYLSSFSYLEEIEGFDIEIYRYTRGFLHHKALLLDGSAAAIGTANFDNRSFRLNFEITAVVVDAGFTAEVEAMFEADFTHCAPVNLSDLHARPLWFRTAVSVARLLGPIQ